MLQAVAVPKKSGARAGGSGARASGSRKRGGEAVSGPIQKWLKGAASAREGMAADPPAAPPAERQASSSRATAAACGEATEGVEDVAQQEAVTRPSARGRASKSSGKGEAAAEEGPGGDCAAAPPAAAAASSAPALPPLPPSGRARGGGSGRLSGKVSYAAPCRASAAAAAEPAEEPEDASLLCAAASPAPAPAPARRSGKKGSSGKGSGLARAATPTMHTAEDENEAVVVPAAGIEGESKSLEEAGAGGLAVLMPEQGCEEPEEGCEELPGLGVGQAPLPAAHGRASGGETAVMPSGGGRMRKTSGAAAAAAEMCEGQVALLSGALSRDSGGGIPSGGFAPGEAAAVIPSGGGKKASGAAAAAGAPSGKTVGIPPSGGGKGSGAAAAPSGGGKASGSAAAADIPRSGGGKASGIAPGTKKPVSGRKRSAGEAAGGTSSEARGGTVDTEAAAPLRPPLANRPVPQAGTSAAALQNPHAVAGRSEPQPQHSHAVAAPAGQCSGPWPMEINCHMKLIATWNLMDTPCLLCRELKSALPPTLPHYWVTQPFQLRGQQSELCTSHSGVRMAPPAALPPDILCARFNCFLCISRTCHTPLVTPALPSGLLV